MNGPGRKFLLLILAAALSLPAAACGSGATGPGAPGSGGPSGSGSGDDDYQLEDGVPSYGEAIERAREAADKSEQKQREIEDNLEEAEGGY